MMQRIAVKHVEAPTLARRSPKWTAVLDCGHSVTVIGWEPPWAIGGVDHPAIRCATCVAVADKETR